MKDAFLDRKRDEKSAAILSLLPAVLLLAFFDASASDRPSLFGLAVPYPHESPELVAPIKLPYYRIETVVPAVLEIDKKGKVTSITPQNSADTPFTNYANEWLTSFTFEPATFEGEKVSSRLPLNLQFQPRVRLPDVHFPIDSSGNVVNADLYFKAFGMNGIEMPRVEEFPTYFCDVQRSDTSVAYPYVLVSIQLDDSGQVLNTEPVRSTIPACQTQIMSAILWAKFSPAVVRGTPTSTPCYLLISFFPHLHYPTRVWQRSAPDSLSLLERYRVRLLPDTVGLMAAPLPSWSSGYEFSFRGYNSAIRDTISAALYIDTTGQARLERFGSLTEEARRTIRDVTSHLEFYPALDYQGKPHRYFGLVSFIFQASSKIRIVCHWLEQGDSVSRD
jgi:hypothetical protein